MFSKKQKGVEVHPREYEIYCLKRLPLDDCLVLDWAYFVSMEILLCTHHSVYDGLQLHLLGDRWKIYEL